MPEIIETETQEISVMSLNGDGTQENPYQITTVAEFRSMNDSEAYFKLMNDLDVNDSEWAADWGSVTLAYADFDGDGHEIRNFHCTTASFLTIASGSGEFHNCKLLNIFCTFSGSNAYFIYSSDRPIFAECEITVTSTSASWNTANFRNISFSRCAITLQGVCGVPFYNCFLDKCMVKFVDCLIINSNSTVLFYRSNTEKVTQSCFLGKIKLGANLTSGGLIECHSSYRAQSVYVALEIDKNGFAISTTANLMSISNPTNTCFYDVELMGHTFATQTNVHALTTEQCKDKDYLNSIGFLVV